MPSITLGIQLMSLRISDELAAKANSFPESSYGATTVTLILLDGRRIDQVVLAGASVIVKVGGRYVSVASDLDFSLSEIADVFPTGRLGMLRSWVAALFRKVNRL
jgi:hypothetical protein